MNKSRPSLFAVIVHLLPAFLLCVMFAAVGIMHVSSRVMVVRTGYQLSKLQNESRTLARENDRLKLELATLKSPRRLERLAREELGMAPPSPAAVITLRQTEEKAPRQARGDGVSARGGAVARHEVQGRRAAP